MKPSFRENLKKNLRFALRQSKQSKKTEKKQSSIFSRFWGLAKRLEHRRIKGK